MAQGFLGVVALIEDQGDAFQGACNRFEATYDFLEMFFEYGPVLKVSLINPVKEGKMVLPGDQEQQAQLPEVNSPLLVFAPLGKRAATIGGSNVGKKVAHIAKQGIELDLLSLDQFQDQSLFDEGKRRNWYGLHLIPEVLAVKFGQRHSQEVRKARMSRKTIMPVPLAGWLAGPSDGGKQKRTSYGKAVAHLLARFGQMPIDGLDDFKLPGDIKQQRYSTVTVTSDFVGNTLGEAFEQVFGASQIGENDRSGFAVDSA